MKRKLFTFTVILVTLILPFIVNATGGKAVVKKEIMEITWNMRIISGEDTTWFLQEMVEKKFPVKIIANGIYHGDKEKINVMLASGDYPDVCNLPDIHQYNADGLLRWIPKDMIIEYMPNYTERLNERHPVGWLLNRNPANENEYLSILGIADNPVTSQWYPSFRIDWAKKVGFELPTYEEKKWQIDPFGRVFFLDEDFTLEWLESLLIALRDGDPDGNGKKDTIPWGSYNSKSGTWEPIMGAFGFTEDRNLLVNGKLTHWCIAPGYKEFLKLANRWWEEGLLDSEFASISSKMMWEKAGKGLIGAAVSTAAYAAMSEEQLRTRLPNIFSTIEEAKAGAEVVLIAPPIGPTGKRGSKIGWDIGPIGRAHQTIGKQVSDEKLAMILQIMDWARYGENDIWAQAEFGKPGVHFTWAGEPWNSTCSLIPTADVEEGYLKTGYFGDYTPYCRTMERFTLMYPAQMASFYVDFLMDGKGSTWQTKSYKLDYFNETKELDIRREYGATMNTIIDEFYYQAITGEIDIDAEWDSYVANWRKNGGGLLLAEMEKQPIRDEMVKGNIVY